ncbi:M35 family metallo-endopeptidase [Myxococcus landrumensis]|uniref:Peptidase M35 n=1 Tax=Myxococcus landrumensis TaxID=2813577 RepID=A0ABX7NE23_9BACT|nr:M35 family metallo-endopeptidase [Myxococcus landrumus]QSQ17081.1 peptidase M35 [Myxococcus landrumus]
MQFCSRGRINWWMGVVVSASLLGACGSPDEHAGEVLVEAETVRDAVAGDVTVTLSVPRQSLAASEGVSVTVTLTNVTQGTVRLLKRDTPVEGLKSDLFSVSVDGAAVEYQGRYYKWGPPQPSDYLSLAGGESVSYTVDLAATYDFARTGNYSLRYGAGVQDSTEGQADVSQLSSESLSVFVEGRPFVDPGAEEVGSVSAMALTTANCNATRTTQATRAFNDAKTMANGSVSWLNNPPSPYTRFKTWFGPYNATTRNQIRTHFNTIKGAFDTKPVIIDCGCTDNVYAYVYKSRPYRIYVCNLFWSAPPTGTDSKAGTLIHEMSHFTAVADTDDWAYGQNACRGLANSNPGRARDNADSHEYFAENTPRQ